MWLSWPRPRLLPLPSSSQLLGLEKEETFNSHREACSNRLRKISGKINFTLYNYMFIEKAHLEVQRG